MRSPLLLLASLLSLSITIAARTVTFDDGDSHLVYAPDGAWSVVEGADYSAGSARQTTARGGQVTLAFAGQQISLYGSTTASFAVFVDGKTTPTSSSSSSASSNATSSRFFVLKGLAAEQAHNLTLVVTGDGALVLDRIAIAFSNAVSTTPAFLPVGTTGFLSTATLTSSSTSSLAPSSTSRAVDPHLRGTSRAGLIAGSIIGSLGAFALLIFLTCLFLRRRKQRHSTSYSPDLGAQLRTAQAEHAKRKSSQSLFASAFNRSRSSPLPFATLPLETDNGGISSFPRPALSHSFAASARLSPPTSNQGSNWPSFSFLTRASSWRLKADRLPETRRFYNLGRAGLPSTKPPEGRLPAVPARLVGGEGREMEERWRTEGPRVVLAGAAAGSGRGGGGAGMKEVRWDEREPRTVQQVWGEAMSDYDAASETGSGRVRVQSPAATHGRRRSFPPEPDDLPLPPPPPPPHQQQHHPSHSHSTIHTSHNPFNSTSSSHSHSHSYHASHPSHGSSSSSHVEGTTTSDSHPSAAHIHTAHSVSLPSQAHQARPHLPVRTSSKREVHETVRAGPEGEGVVRTGSMLERRPTLTEAPGGSPARAASGSARAERRRHQSHAGLIEVVADGHDEQERDEQDGRRRHQRRRTRSNGLADPLPGEEDRPAFFQQRETLPRYDASRGDPRLPSR
ncbi:hypothetical protein NBRC10513v2_001841 [Rhodotorula toruloides]|uniref:Proteophosphoglycan ppg4 n=2 Tax=Rhodotorula toruloides TaxID=5286 RepID=A0A0K3CGP0_RHOTO